MEEVKENNEKINKRNKISIIVIICSLLVMGFCATYLIHSYTMLKKYDVDSFKLGDYVIPTLNSAIRTNRKLVVAEEEENLITLKYDITKMTLNDVYAYLGKLSLEDYIVVDLEDLYMRAVNYEKDIQIKT